MNNGFIHDQLLVGPLARQFVSLGSLVKLEFSIRTSNFVGHIDLLALHDGLLIACEAENSPERIRRDIVKAEALGADTLIIITPNAGVRNACLRKLQQVNRSSGIQIYVLTPAKAHQWVVNKKTLCPALLSQEDNKDKNTTNP